MFGAGKSGPLWWSGPVAVMSVPGRERAEWVTSALHAGCEGGSTLTLALPAAGVEGLVVVWLPGVREPVMGSIRNAP